MANIRVVVDIVDQVEGGAPFFTAGEVITNAELVEGEGAWVTWCNTTLCIQEGDFTLLDDKEA